MRKVKKKGWRVTEPMESKTRLVDDVPAALSLAKGAKGMKTPLPEGRTMPSVVLL